MYPILHKTNLSWHLETTEAQKLGQKDNTLIQSRHLQAWLLRSQIHHQSSYETLAAVELGKKISVERGERGAF